MTDAPLPRVLLVCWLAGEEPQFSRPLVSPQEAGGRPGGQTPWEFVLRHSQSHLLEHGSVIHSLQRQETKGLQAWGPGWTEPPASLLRTNPNPQGSGSRDNGGHTPPRLRAEWNSRWGRPFLVSCPLKEHASHQAGKSDFRWEERPWCLVPSGWC